MQFKYVESLGLINDNLLTLGTLYSGEVEGDRIRLDDFPASLFHPSRFEFVPITEESNPQSNTAGGMKYDGDKPRMDLLFSGCPNALEAISSILTFGAKKYAAHSWQTVPQGDERYLAALLRHLTAVGKGEVVDAESGMSHLAHAACNALFILELELRKSK